MIMTTRTTPAAGQDRCVVALHNLYESRGSAAVDAIAPLLTEDFKFVPAGFCSQLQATYPGADGFADFLHRQASWTNDTWWPVLDEILVGEHWIVAVVNVDPVRTDGTHAHFQILHRWQRSGDQFCGFRSFVDRQDEYDDFHTAAC